MSCKLSDKCDNVFACNVLRPEVELLGCSFYKPKKPMTKEEYLKSCNTEQLAEWIADKINDTVYSMSIDAWAGDVDRDEYWQRKSEWVEWLKQPHKE